MDKLNKNDKVQIISNDITWKNKTGIVIKQSDDIFYDSDNRDITSVRVKVKLLDSDDDKYLVTQDFPRYALKLITDEQINKNQIAENLLYNLDEDYIYDYVYAETLDSIEPSWFFAQKIADVEDLTIDQVLKDARKYKYTIYRLSTNQKDSYIIAAPKCSKEMIYNDYIDYVIGDCGLKEI